MKLFSWVTSKLNGRLQGNKEKPTYSNTKSDPVVRGSQREEFSDWPHGLLAIGTFGNKALKEDPVKVEDIHLQEATNSPAPEPCDHPQDFTPEEVGNIEKELRLLFSQTQGSHGGEHDECRVTTLNERDGDEEEEEDEEEIMSQIDNCQQSNSTSMVPNRAKDVCNSDKKSSGFSKKSLSFLLKKMFVCRSGFNVAPPNLNLRDPLPLVHSESRMEKILRKILHKKIYPQGTCPNTAAGSNYFGKSLTMEKPGRDHHEHNLSDEDDQANNESKWVKTDTEYIVLEV